MNPEREGPTSFLQLLGQSEVARSLVIKVVQVLFDQFIKPTGPVTCKGKKRKKSKYGTVLFYSQMYKILY